MEIKTFYVLSYKELFDLIKEHFKCNNYDIAFENELHNGSCYSIDDYADDDDLDNIEYGKNLTIDKIKEEHSCEQIEHIIWSLSLRKILPKGDYLIICSW